MKTLKIYGNCVGLYSLFLATIVIDIDTGLITEIHPGVKLAGAYEMKGCLIYPGFLDVHVHCRQDTSQRENYKETFETAGQAAINGGVTHICSMGNTPIPPIDDESYAAIEDLAEDSDVPVTLYAMIGPDTRRLKRKVFYKLCLARTTGAHDIIFIPNKKLVDEVLRRYHGENVSFHAEDTEIIEQCRAELLHENRRPPEAEISSVDFALQLISKHNLTGKICHCSVCQATAKIAAARRRGVRVTCEVTPGHLLLDTSMITEENRPWFQVNPPLRSPENRLGSMQALLRGEIDMLATDHAPHTEADNMSEKGVSGLPHLDTLGHVTTTLIEKHGFQPSDIRRVCSQKPAEFLNPFLDRKKFGHGYGDLKPGFTGSLTIIDPNNPITITKAHLKTKCGWSPFEGWTFPGRVRATVVRGKLYEMN